MGWQDKVSKCQIAALIKGSILNTTNRESVRPTVGAHAGIAATEDEVASIRAANRTAPIEAGGTDTEERTTAAAAVARQGQLQWGGKSSGSIFGSPAKPFLLPLCSSWYPKTRRTGIVFRSGTRPHVGLYITQPIKGARADCNK